MLVILAAFAYAALPNGHHVRDAGKVVGFTPPPRSITALWIGDSYTVGTGADSIESDYVSQVSAHFGWAWGVDAEGATGFVNNGHTLFKTNSVVQARLSQDKKNHPQLDLVVIDAGRNDGSEPYHQVTSAVVKYFDTVTRLWPSARVLVIAPSFIRLAFGPLTNFRVFEKKQAQQRDWSFIDPIGEGWINSSNPESLVWHDHVHPDQAGHNYYAKHLEAKISQTSIVARKSSPSVSRQS